MGTLADDEMTKLDRIAASSPWNTGLRNVNVPTKEVAPGVQMPIVNIGTWTSGSVRPESASLIVGNWLAQGGRGVDTALIYYDQAKVAKAIADAGLARKDVFITSKIPACSQA